jgi:DNA-binding response OmpR family regulator
MNTMSPDPAVILLVDGDPIGMAATLDGAGYDCHCARDPQAAMRAVRSLRLDLIVCDLNIDGQSGLQLTRELQREYGEDIPLMFVTGAQSPDIVRKVHEAGGAYYLRKPFDPDVLVELVGKALWMPHLVKAQIARHHAPEQMPRPAGMTWVHRTESFEEA